MSVVLLVVWLLPLAGALGLWAFGPLLRRGAGVIGSTLVLASFGCAIVLMSPAEVPGGFHERLWSWAPGFNFGLQLDALSLLWTFIITGVGGLIHIYSIGYMWSDRALARFFAYMNFFVFAMLTLVLSDNVVGLLVGWGLVGLASYFLIGFWFERPAAVAAARKAFIINVVGDVGIMFAIFALYAATGAIAFADIFAKVGIFSNALLLTVCVALFIGAAAKSAQVPLHTWLPDAMEGPTPVSALIHAATMVTAGVYLIARFAPLWNHAPAAQELVGVVGAITMVAGALLGCAQWDIKRILAYSTMSQIGYMILGVGIGAYQAGVLHFFTHAFFKAQLFLAAGIVIHTLGNEQDIRRMGGLRERLPFAYWAMLLGTLAIVGFPGFSGFFSKDAVIYAAAERGHPWLFVAGALTAGLTAYYMFRMLFVTFFGPDREDVPAALLAIAPGAPATHAEAPSAQHAPGWLMQFPVAILMVPTIFAGYPALGGTASLWYGWFGTLFGTTENNAGVALPLSEWGSSTLIMALVAIGIIVAYLRYGAPAVASAAVDRLRGEALRLPAALSHAFWVDDALALLFVRPVRALGCACMRFVDPYVIDAGIRDIVWVTGVAGYLVRALQNGLVRAYALTIVVGAACFIAYYTLVGTAR